MNGLTVTVSRLPRCRLRLYFDDLSISCFILQIFNFSMLQLIMKLRTEVANVKRDAEEAKAALLSIQEGFRAVA